MSNLPSSHVAASRLAQFDADLRVEQVVLGCFFMEPELLRATRLSRDDFAHELHAEIFGELLSLNAGGLVPDCVVVSTALSAKYGAQPSREAVNVLQYLNDLIMTVPSVDAFKTHEHYVLSEKCKRQIRIELARSNSPVSVAEMLASVRSACRTFEKKIGPSTGLSFISATDIKSADLAGDAEDLVSGLFQRGAFIALYGESNVGKSFVSVDICCSISRSQDWMGRSTHGGLVIYVATESPNSILRRVAAYKARHRVDLGGFIVVSSPFDLHTSDQSVNELIDLVKFIEGGLGKKVELIAIDTLSRALSGADENSASSMSVVVRRIDTLRDKTKTAVLMVHHTGKETNRGMRGWSGLRAAVDSEICVSSQKSGKKKVEITKQRDFDSVAEPFLFELEYVSLGVNSTGHEWGSCVVIPCSEPPTCAEDAEVNVQVTSVLTDFVRHAGGRVKRQALVDHYIRVFHRSKSSAYQSVKNLIDRGVLLADGTSVTLI